MNQDTLWLVALGLPILVGILSVLVLRATTLGRTRLLPSSALWENPTSAEAPPTVPLDPLLVPPGAGSAPSPERVVTAEIDRHEAALLICRELGNRRAEGEVLGRLGLAFAALGATSRAVEMYRERLELAQAAGDRKSEASTLDNLSLAYAELGEIVRAQECHEAAQTIFQDLGDKRAQRDATPPQRQEPADRRQARHAMEALAQQVALGHPFGFWIDTTSRHGRIPHPVPRPEIRPTTDRSHLYADFESQLHPPDAVVFEEYLAKLRGRMPRA